jgi:hypothetical protein
MEAFRHRENLDARLHPRPMLAKPIMTELMKLDCVTA